MKNRGISKLVLAGAIAVSTVNAAANMASAMNDQVAPQVVREESWIEWLLRLLFGIGQEKTVEKTVEKTIKLADTEETSKTLEYIKNQEEEISAEKVASDVDIDWERTKAIWNLEKLLSQDKDKGFCKVLTKAVGNVSSLENLEWILNMDVFDYSAIRILRLIALEYEKVLSSYPDDFINLVRKLEKEWSVENLCYFGNFQILQKLFSRKVSKEEKEKLITNCANIFNEPKNSKHEEWAAAGKVGEEVIWRNSEKDGFSILGFYVREASEKVTNPELVYEAIANALGKKSKREFITIVAGLKDKENEKEIIKHLRGNGLIPQQQQANSANIGVVIDNVFYSYNLCNNTVS